MRASEFINEGRIWDAIKRTASRLFGRKSSRRQIQAAAINDLAMGMQSMGKTDYDSIDKLMKFISKQYKITPQELHDMWVKRLGQSPDDWIKKRI